MQVEIVKAETRSPACLTHQMLLMFLVLHNFEQWHPDHVTPDHKNLKALHCSSRVQVSRVSSTWFSEKYLTMQHLLFLLFKSFPWPVNDVGLSCQSNVVSNWLNIIHLSSVLFFHYRITCLKLLVQLYISFLAIGQREFKDKKLINNRRMLGHKLQ